MAIAGRAPALKSNRLWLALIPPAIAIFILALVIGPWSRNVDLFDLRFSIICHINALIWLIVLCWASHHLVYQVASLFPRASHCVGAADATNVRFVILYLTCDDFVPSACSSCGVQTYPGNSYRVLICDDSQEAWYLSSITVFAHHNRSMKLVRRLGRAGFKAGNVNHAIDAHTTEDDEWIVIVDADQHLPETYLSELAAVIQTLPPDVAFVQAAHRSDHASPDSKPGSTRFQNALGPEIDIFYHRDMPMRETFGFMPFLGHGAAIRRSTLKTVGNLPEIVSEDYAFALRVRRNGHRGTYAASVCSSEAFPRDFSAFVTRLKKFAGGCAELFKTEARPFLRHSRVSLAEKIDFLMLLLWYAITPLILGNAYLSAYVCHRLWTASHPIPFLHPFLPYLFLVMLALSVPIILSVTRRPFDVVRYWFWSAAIYGAVLPAAAWQFCRSFWKKPRFDRTPKNPGDRARYSWRERFSMVLIGSGTLILAKFWYSPFSPILASYGAALASSPLFVYLNHRSLLGRLARFVVWLPGAALLIGFYAMLHLGTF
jgi:hypothetical protein